MLIVPIQPLPNQTLQVQLAGQACTVDLRQLSTGMFFDLTIVGKTIIAGVLCQNLNRLVRSLYLGFSGDFAFVDLQGADDPVYTGLGSRFLLVYLAPDDLPAGR